MPKPLRLTFLPALIFAAWTAWPVAGVAQQLFNQPGLPAQPPYANPFNQGYYLGPQDNPGQPLPQGLTAYPPLPPPVNQMPILTPPFYSSLTPFGGWPQTLAVTTPHGQPGTFGYPMQPGQTPFAAARTPADPYSAAGSGPSEPLPPLPRTSTRTLNNFTYYPFYYFPHNYWPVMDRPWPEPTGAPYQPPPAYMAFPAFHEPNWRYELWQPQRYYRGFHFWLDQF